MICTGWEELLNASWKILSGAGNRKICPQVPLGMQIMSPLTHIIDNTSIVGSGEMKIANLFSLLFPAGLPSLADHSADINKACKKRWCLFYPGIQFPQSVRRNILNRCPNCIWCVVPQTANSKPRQKSWSLIFQDCIFTSKSGSCAWKLQVFIWQCQNSFLFHADVEGLTSFTWLYRCG